MDSINTTELVKTLSQLTPDQRIKIAKILDNASDYSCVDSRYAWAGHDLVNDVKINGVNTRIVQIDYSDNCTTLKSRFRYYIDLYEYHASQSDLATIISYLRSINSKI